MQFAHIVVTGIARRALSEGYSPKSLARLRQFDGERAIDDVLDAGRICAVKLAVSSGGRLSQAPR